MISSSVTPSYTFAPFSKCLILDQLVVAMNKNSPLSIHGIPLHSCQEHQNSLNPTTQSQLAFQVQCCLYQLGQPILMDWNSTILRCLTRLYHNFSIFLRSKWLEVDIANQSNHPCISKRLFSHVGFAWTMV